MDTPAQNRNPWLWIPSLYFVQGVPYVVAMTVSVIMYKRLGISNTDIALYTSWLYLPWVIKPLWSPFVDMFRTKRFWVVTLQMFIGAALACVALTLPGPRFFQYTLAVFWLMAFASATHDIAADGFYMLGLPQYQQAAFAGVRSTFYRIAMIAGQGLLVMLVGYIESNTGLKPIEINVRAQTSAASTPASRPSEVQGDLLTSSTPIHIETTVQPKATVNAVIDAAKKANQDAGFTFAEEEAKKGKKTQSRFARFIKERFGESPRQSLSVSGNVASMTMQLVKPPSHGKSVVVILTHSSGDESITVAEGARLTFTETNWNKPATVVFQIDPKLRSASEARFTATAGNTLLAWVVCFGILTAVFLLLAGYHALMLPRPSADVPVRSGGVLAGFGRTFALFFQKPRIIATLAFLLLYRFAEAQLVKLVAPFLLDPRELGGIGLTTGQLGFVYGTVGIICLLIGGLSGGYLVARHGLKHWLWIMVFAIHLPDLAFVFLAYVQPTSFVVVNLAVAVEQFGYGFGFTAYMLYMIMVAEGENKTSHYALCTGFMALGMMLPGMFSGWLQDLIGYRHFFVWVMLSTIPGFIVALLVKVDPAFGRKPRGAIAKESTPAIPVEALAREE